MFMNRLKEATSLTSSAIEATWVMGGDGESCARGAGIVGAVRAGEFFMALVFSIFLGNDLSAWIRMERPANHLS
jgi:hypothetical protein